MNMFTPPNDDQGNYLDIHYISSSVGVISQISMPILSGYDTGPSIPLFAHVIMSPQIYATHNTLSYVCPVTNNTQSLFVRAPHHRSTHPYDFKAAPPPFL